MDFYDFPFIGNGKSSQLTSYIDIPTGSIMDIFWLVVYLPLWKMMEFVSWDDEIPNWME